VPPSSRTGKPGDRIIMLLATGLGAGAAPRGPGTVGSLWGPPLAWTMQESGLTGWTWGLVAVAIILLGVPICARAAEILNRKDPGSVVYDEIAAFTLVFAVAPVDAVTAVLGFVFFRVFDIWKPWPVRRLELLPRGWGIMADDLVAGAYAAAALGAAWHWLL
jgi:phosphatidylglycerophosphatase A